MSSEGGIVLQTNKFDVLFGRGKHTNENAGNQYFRQRVIDLAPEYVRVVRVEKKDSIAKNLIAEIRGLGGRFLRTVNKKCIVTEGADPSSSTCSSNQWFEASSLEVERKVKQAFRDAWASQRRMELMKPPSQCVRPDGKSC